MTSVPTEKIGGSGPYISRLIAGCWRLHEFDSWHSIEDFIQNCFSLGITTFDHADVYGNGMTEAAFGEALKKTKTLKNRIQIITKCGVVTGHLMPGTDRVYYDSSPTHIRWSVERSLKSFGVERIDICMLHRPDLLMDAEETAAQMELLVSEGKVAFWGVSNFQSSQCKVLQSFLKAPLIANQIEISLCSPNAVLQGALFQGTLSQIGVMAWSPLGGGLLTSKRLEHIQPSSLALKLQEMSVKYNVQDISAVAIAWLLRHPCNIFPVLGTSSYNHLKAASESIKVSMSKSDWYELTAASGHPVI